MIKIGKLKLKPQSHTIERDRQLKQMLQSDPLLATTFDPAHPFLRHEILSFTGALSYRIWLRSHVLWVTATTLMFEFKQQAPDEWRRAFLLGYTSAVRTLLFSEIGHENQIERDNLILANESGIQWDAIETYLEMACQALPFEAVIEREPDLLRLILSDPGQSVQPMAIELYHEDLNVNYYSQYEKAGHWATNELLQDYLKIQIARVVMNARTEVFNAAA